MFTGLISDIGKIIDIKYNNNDIIKYKISSNYNIKTINIGSSICCSGACMTVISKYKLGIKTIFEIDVSKESLSITNLRNWKINTLINLERSLKINDELGGHIVNGHIHGIVKITNMFKEGESICFELKIKNEFTKYIVPKGSISLNGTSLTINNVNNNKFKINIIPHTLKTTTWSNHKIGDLINFEIDQIAFYVFKHVEYNFKNKFIDKITNN